MQTTVAPAESVTVASTLTVPLRKGRRMLGMDSMGPRVRGSPPP